MTRLISVGLLAIVLSTAAGVSGQPRPSPFPLADGNRWTFRSVELNGVHTIAVERAPQGLVLRGLPGAPSLRVRWLGQTVQAWDTGNRRWEAILRFGEPAGSSYRVNLAETVLWRNVVVTVGSKQARVEDYAGRERRATRFVFASKSKIADAGLEWMAFAPGVGPVRIAEQTIAGTRELALTGHRLK